MSTQTTNYGLIKPADNETADIAVINQNMDTLDTKLKTVEEAAAAAPESDSITDDMIGSRTPDSSQDPADPGTGKIGQILSWISNRIVAITGSTHWWDAPAATLSALNTAVGTIANLATTAKDNVVNAINEVANGLTTHKADTTQHLSILTTKGDLVWASAENTPARLPVGSNGQYLMVNSDGTLGWGDLNVIQPTKSQEISFYQASVAAGAWVTVLAVTSGKGILSRISATAGYSQSPSTYIQVRITTDGNVSTASAGNAAELVYDRAGVDLILHTYFTSSLKVEVYNGWTNGCNIIAHVDYALV